MTKIFETFPELLKYGFAGLAVIFAVLLFFLFRGQFKKTLTNKDFLIRSVPFILITGFLLWASWTSIDKGTSMEQAKLIDSLRTNLMIYKGTSPTTQKLQENYDKIKNKNDSLEKVIKRINHHIKENIDLLDNTVMLQIVEGFEFATANTLGKRDINISQEELTFRCFKNAIFQNVYEFGADTLVLRKALQILKKRGGDINVEKLIEATPQIIELRRKWIKKVRVKLENEIDNFPPQEQDRPEIKMEYPKELWILDRYPYTVTVTESDLPRIVFESDLLKKI